MNKLVDGETWKNFFDKWTLDRVGHIDHTPVFGDPLASNTFISSLEYIARLKPSINVHANTNASLRTTDYWKELASVMSFNKENWNSYTFNCHGKSYFLIYYPFYLPL